LVNRLWWTCFQRASTVALLPDRTEFLCHRWHPFRFTLLNTPDVYAGTVFLVALPSDRVRCFQRLGNAVFVELYAGEFDYQGECLEDRRTEGITAAGDVRNWVDVRRFHRRRNLEPRQCRDTATDV